jgi:hypothetical protein
MELERGYKLPKSPRNKEKVNARNTKQSDTQRQLKTKYIPYRLTKRKLTIDKINKDNKHIHSIDKERESEIHSIDR